MSRALAFDAAKLALHRRRKRVNAIALALSLAAMAFGVFWLIWILFETLRLGFGGLGWQVLTEMTPPPQAEIGGLANAIYGSLMMVGLATALGTPELVPLAAASPSARRRDDVYICFITART